MSNGHVSSMHQIAVDKVGARDRHHKAEPAMRSSRVVVPDVASKDPLEMAARDDEEEVEALLTRGPHPPLGVRVRARRANRRADDLGAFRGEDLVEGTRELRVPVANEETEATTAFVEVRDEVPGYLSHPSPNWVSRDPEDVDHATFDLDYEQHVEPLERDGIDGEEVRCEDACCLSAEKLGPARAVSSRRRSDSVARKDVAHARR